MVHEHTSGIERVRRWVEKEWKLEMQKRQTSWWYRYGRSVVRNSFVLCETTKIALLIIPRFYRPAHPPLRLKLWLCK